jgi:hypothetical protein
MSKLIEHRVLKRSANSLKNIYMEKCSKFLAIKGMQIKTSLRFYLILVRMAIIKKTTTDAS